MGASSVGAFPDPDPTGPGGRRRGRPEAHSESAARPAAEAVSPGLGGASSLSAPLRPPLSCSREHDVSVGVRELRSACGTQ